MLRYEVVPSCVAGTVLVGLTRWRPWIVEGEQGPLHLLGNRLISPYQTLRGSPFPSSPSCGVFCSSLAPFLGKGQFVWKTSGLNLTRWLRQLWVHPSQVTVLLGQHLRCHIPTDASSVKIRRCLPNSLSYGSAKALVDCSLA